MTLERLEAGIDHRFSRRELLTQALTHRSYGIPHNERLEFLGDGILNGVVAASLYRRFPQLNEGDLSRLRASLVRQDALASLARQLGLGDHLLLGDGEQKSGGNRRPSMLADALEAVFGAVYVDAGFDVAARVIESLYEPLLQHADPGIAGKDSKTELQELLQGRRLGLPQYEMRAARGAAHAQTFDIECVVADLGISGAGSGPSRKVAEQQAAAKVLELINAK